MPRIVSEPARPSAGRLAFVEQCAGRIAPDGGDLEDWLRAYVRNHRERFAFDLDIIERYAGKDETLLEVGSVPLVLTLALKELGYRVQGVDIDPGRFSSAIAAHHLVVHACNIETDRLPLVDGSCDVVIFNEIFEHLRINPIFTLMQTHRVLRPGGRLLVSTPNLRSFRGIVNFLFHNRCFSCSGNVYDEYQKLERLGHMGHVREYTTTEVIEFLTRIGFRVESLMFRGKFAEPLAKAGTRVFPRLRPFVTYVACRADAGADRDADTAARLDRDAGKG